MTLKQLEAFYWAVNLGSFAIAAERLHVTQSSLSKRIGELEQSVGILLFDRTKKRAQLTEAGQRLVVMAGRMLELTEAMRTEVRDSTTLTGICRFGVSELVSLTWLPAFIRAVRNDHPALVLQPYVDLSRNLERRLLRGELDFAVSPGPSDSDQVSGHTICPVEFTWIASPARFKKRAVLRAHELENHPVIAQTEGSGLTRAIEIWANEHGIRMQRALYCNSFMAIVGLTRADLGISFLPAHFMKPWLASGSLIALRSDPPLRPLNYSFQRRKDDNRGLLRVMRAYVTSAADFTASPDQALLPSTQTFYKRLRRVSK